ncbi:xrn 5 -3 exonuclease n-terminus protein, partial [Cystoisospora suis]
MIGIGTPAEPPPSSSSPSSFSRKSSRAYGSYSHSSSSPSSKDRNLFLPRHHHHHPERHVSPSASSDFPHIITYALPGSHAALSKRLVHPACLPNSVVVEVLPVKSIELCEDSEEPLVTYEDKTVFRLLPLLSLPSPLPRRLIPPRHLSSSSLLNLPGSDGEKDEERRMPLDKKKEKREVNEQGEEEHHVVEMKRRGRGGRGGDREKEKRGERRLSKQQEKEEEEESLMNGENGGFPDGTCVMISNPRDRMFGCIGETVKILPKEEEEDSHVIDHAKREKRDKDMKDEKICVVFRNPRAKFDSGQISQAKLELEISGQIVGRALPPPLYSVRDAARELRMPVAVFYALASSFYVRLDGRREDCGLHIISFARGEGQRAGGGGEADGETRGPDGCTSSFVPLYCPGYSYPSYMSQGHREEGRKRSPRRGGGRDAVQWRLFSHVLTPAALDAIEAILNEYPSVSACLSKAA